MLEVAACELMPGTVEDEFWIQAGSFAHLDCAA